jgi:hypothetical protein
MLLDERLALRRLAALQLLDIAVEPGKQPFVD